MEGVINEKGELEDKQEKAKWTGRRKGIAARGNGLCKNGDKQFSVAGA